LFSQPPALLDESNAARPRTCQADHRAVRPLDMRCTRHADSSVATRPSHHAPAFMHALGCRLPYASLVALNLACRLCAPLPHLQCARPPATEQCATRSRHAAALPCSAPSGTQRQPRCSAAAMSPSLRPTAGSAVLRLNTLPPPPHPRITGHGPVADSSRGTPAQWLDSRIAELCGFRTCR
jgi:hypothetical protein